MKRTLALLTGIALSAMAAPGAAQVRDASDLEMLTVLEIDPAVNEIRARESRSTRIRILELDERTALTGGSLGGSLTLQDLRPGDTIRAPGVVDSTSDRVRPERIEVIAAPRSPGETGIGLGGERRDPAAPGRALEAGRGALPVDPPEGRSGADPGATDRGTRGTGSQQPPR